MRFTENLLFVLLRAVVAVSLKEVVHNRGSSAIANSSPNVAVCILGELRTFGMPAVHESILQAVHAWNADVFFHYHTRYDPVAMAGAHRGGAVACEENLTAIHGFSPKSTRQIPEIDKCSGKAAVQFVQLDNCFRDAEDHARKAGKQYDVFVKLRPDFLIMHPVPLPTFTEPTDLNLYGSHDKSDLAFVMTKDGLDRFRSQTNAQSLRQCLSIKPVVLNCCWEYVLEMFKKPLLKQWDIPGGLVRNNMTLEKSWGVNPTKLMKQLNGDGTLSCRVVGTPA